MSIRPVKRIVEATPTLEGAGVKLRRAFGFGETEEFDPFLLLDDFRNERPRITSPDFLASASRHRDDHLCAGRHGRARRQPGQPGTLGAGDVQWMTAGSGILHQEMPKGDPNGRMHGFQLWANLPSHLKMSKPRYQDVQSRGARDHRRRRHPSSRGLRRFLGKKGPVDGIAADPRYLDVYVPPGKRKVLPVELERHAFAYVFEGAGRSATPRRRSGCSPRSDGPVRPVAREETGNRSLVLFDRGDEVVVQAGEQGIRFLLVSGKPIEEPVAWYGPIVMNTQEELRQAVSELNDGTFIK